MLDEKDGLILRELKQDARQSTTRIARRTRIPRVTVRERIQRLEEKGVIKRFTLVPDYSLLGRPTTAFVLVGYSPSPTASAKEKNPKKKLCQGLARLDGVFELYSVSGEYDFLLKARCASMQELSGLADEIKALPGVSKTVVMPCFEALKEEL